MSNSPPEAPPKEFLIVRLTPHLVERGALWFGEHHENIRCAVHTDGFWRKNAFCIAHETEMKPGAFIRRLTDFGYEKTAHIFGRGEFSQRGNIVDIWAINETRAWRVEFFGNTVQSIHPIEAKKGAETKKISLASGATLAHISPGDYLVHIDHGIGIFRDFITEREKEYFVVEYAPPREGAEPDRLYVPKDQEKRLSPYIGFNTPRVHRLGGTAWFTTRKKIGEDAEKLAQELLQLYAGRETIWRAPYARDPMLEREFAGAFEFQETDDQTKSLQDIQKDLASEKPMDRIICGDVGFGKTEVAMQTAMRAIIAKKQVALIAPTTILAYEHVRNFQKRFEKFPVEIAGISRITSPSEAHTITKKLAAGTLDILIGTHRILSHDIAFRDLGLVIIDEEQRFGVKQKERFKEMRAETDILSLSATPIPRTLYLALGGLRNISNIQTPPPGRIAIKTFVMPHAAGTIRGAITREMERGGQIYFLHNRVETIEAIRTRVEKLMSRAPQKPKIGVIHGRMKESHMIETINDFREKKYDILLATTIIENGLDFSNANTLIVDDAPRLGLAQAHQIRGRIGRGYDQAYAYFLYKASHLTEKAWRRLEALKEFEELGGGYQIALRDMEIRGAGNILGREQSGAINRVGLNLYCQILAEAVEKARDAGPQ